MDPEEIQREIDYLITWLGPVGEKLFDLAIAQERIYMFEKLRTLIQQKDAAGDQIAVEVLSWAWRTLADV
jgi:hypothetical protein